MIAATGSCAGIENYSQPLGRRPPGSAPWTLLDYFPDDYLLFIDESHLTIPQLGAMFHGEMSRKNMLIDFGFRLPSARDNRPLSFDEFERRVTQGVYVSATPAKYEYQHSEQVVQQVIRPTGLVDPTVEIRETKGQIDDLIVEIQKRVAKGERCLVTTLTKRMSEELADYLLEVGVKVHYLHSELDTLKRMDILRDLRLGVYDVIVGINLLREGLDLPEVSLVAILDADKEGYLRSTPALVQTAGRAARHIEGHVILYADRKTDSMLRMIDETNRRRELQVTFNTENHIIPESIHKAVRDINDNIRKNSEAAEAGELRRTLSKNDLARVIKSLESQMRESAKQLEFERAAILRDELRELKGLMITQEVVERGGLGEKG